MKEKVPLGSRTNFDHCQVADPFAVQNLTWPPSMPVAKVTEVQCKLRKVILFYTKHQIFMF